METDTRRDDRVLATTRALSAFIAPFLLVAFVLLYGFPGRTARLWAWPIQAQMTSMLLASAYLGGCWFFLRVLLVERRWAAVRMGFVSVALFATLLGIATILHWDKFSHGKAAFWVWAGLYFTAPFLVIGAWLANRRYAAPPAPDDVVLSPAERTVVALVGLGALAQGAIMFLAPSAVIDHWPWPLTPLTCRVMGAVFCLGCAGIGAWRDPRWTALRVMLQVEALMLTLMLLAAVRARDEMIDGRAYTWPLLVGVLLMLAGSGYLWVVHERRGRAAEPVG